MYKPAHLASPRRSQIGAVSALVVLSGAAAVIAFSASSASAAVLGSITVEPASGGDETLFGGEIANAQCPAGTEESYFSIDGPGLPPGEALFAPGTDTGTGPQSFSGISIANIKSSYSGSFSGSGSYTLLFNCVDGADGSVSDTYEAALTYTAAAGGAPAAYSVAAAPAPSPSASASPSASPTASATPTASASPTASPSATSTATASASPTASPGASASPTASPDATAVPTTSASPDVSSVSGGSGGGGSIEASGNTGGSGSASALPTTGVKDSELLLGLGATVIAAGGVLALLGRRKGWFHHDAHRL